MIEFERNLFVENDPPTFLPRQVFGSSLETTKCVSDELCSRFIDLIIPSPCIEGGKGSRMVVKYPSMNGLRGNYKAAL